MKGVLTLSLFFLIDSGYSSCVWEFLLHSFLGLMAIIGPKILWLVYLRMETLCNTPQPLLKFLLFWGIFLSSLVWRGLPISTLLDKNKLSVHLSEQKSFRTWNFFSLTSSGTPPFLSSTPPPISAPLGMVYTTGFYAIWTSTICSSFYLHCPGAKSTPWTYVTHFRFPQKCPR